MSLSFPRRGRAIVVSLAIVSIWSTTAAQDDGRGGVPGTSVLVDREKGEEDQIRKRLEWFLSTRDGGVGSLDEIQALRQSALRDVARQVVSAPPGLTNFWTEMGPSAWHLGGWTFGDVAGRVTGIAKGPDGTLYVATAAGGVWKSTNDGLSGQPARRLRDAARRRDRGGSEHPAVLWAGTGDYNSGCEGYFGIGMLRSTNGGASWQERNGSAGTLADVSSFSAILIDPRDSNRVVAAAVERGCSGSSSSFGGNFTTDDAGLTWTERVAGRVHDLQREEQNRDVLWAATAQGVYRSGNNGVTWTKQTASASRRMGRAARRSPWRRRTARSSTRCSWTAIRIRRSSGGPRTEAFRGSSCRPAPPRAKRSASTT